ncbi:hypothetical protein ACQEVM_16730 [Streptomyces sp. CA-243310]|uniref:hypothetical protein n=1 Tax=Streptomyces sp. CA-243310 TaxID=3240056 RepID=UPI003D8A8623
MGTGLLRSGRHASGCRAVGSHGEPGPARVLPDALREIVRLFDSPFAFPVAERLPLGVTVSLSRLLPFAVPFCFAEPATEREPFSQSRAAAPHTGADLAVRGLGP